MHSVILVIYHYMKCVIAENCQQIAGQQGHNVYFPQHWGEQLIVFLHNILI